MSEFDTVITDQDMNRERNRSLGLPTFPSTRVDGCWVAFHYDWNKLVKAVFADELSARQWAMSNFCQVEFATWGQEL